MHSLSSYLHHVREEFAHITWPTKRTAAHHTLVVIVIAAAITLVVAVTDLLLGQLVNSVLGV